MFDRLVLNIKTLTELRLEESNINRDGLINLANGLKDNMVCTSFFYVMCTTIVLNILIGINESNAF
jgi:hypothetical protein